MQQTDVSKRKTATDNDTPTDASAIFTNVGENRKRLSHKHVHISNITEILNVTGNTIIMPSLNLKVTLLRGIGALPDLL